jgi:hypothetical protein
MSSRRTPKPPGGTNTANTMLSRMGCGIVRQSGAQHHIPVPVAFATVTINKHPMAVDVTNLQMRHFRARCPGTIESHQQGAMKGVSRCR